MGGNKLLGSNGFYLRHTFEYFLQRQEQLGMEAIELWASQPHLWIDHYGYEDVTHIKQIMQRYGITAEILSAPSGPYSLCAPDGSIQKIYTYDFYLNCIQVAAKLGIPYLSVRATGGYLDRAADDLFGDCCRSLSSLSRRGADCGVTLLIQTVTRQEANLLTDLYQIQKVLEQIPQIKVLLDTVSMSEAGETFGQWFSALGGKICHVRFLDGRNDGFRVWGEGCYPLKRYVKELLETGYKGSIGLGTTAERCFQKADEADRKNSSRFLKAYNAGKQKGTGCSGGLTGGEGDFNGTD